MSVSVRGIHFPLLSLIIISVVQVSVCQSNLYPFGLDETDETLPRDTDDISSREIALAVPVVFYGQKYSSLYVNQNGLVSFLAEIPTFLNTQFPLDFPSIAALYSDVDTRIVGTIFYRETNAQNLLEQAKLFLVEQFSNASNFSPTSLFIVTWDGVGSYDRKSDKINTFQLIIVNNGEDSYVLFIYDKIEWIQGSGKNPSMPDAIAQAGFISGTGPHFSLEGSGTDQVSNMHKRSNVDKTGVWAFKIGRVNGTPGKPDEKLGMVRSESSTTCASGGATTCHSRAECIDHSPGFCCKCALGFYGNGKTCLENDIPERAVGKVKGVLNGILIDDADLYAYVVPADGRAYTAIAKIVDRIGFDLQCLSVMGMIFGWLFSVTTKDTLNGFQLTGGVFNYTAEVAFLQTGHKVTINQAYTGLDVFNQMKVETRLHGSTAVVPVGMKIEVNDFEVLMTRVSPGIIRSKSNHNYRIVGTSMDNPFSIEQTISYEECKWASPLPPELQTTKMMVGKSYIAYDPAQEIVRYAITSTTSPPDGEDPCKSNKDKCGPFSACVADGINFKCICNLGYEEEYVEGMGTGPHCIDIDECRTGTAECDVTAHCTNREGSYECRCRETYVGNGLTCSKLLTCGDVQCGVNANCSEVRAGEPECRCISGFQGDGLFCLPNREDDDGRTDMEEICRKCDRNAGCIFSPSDNSYNCVCGAGYQGNGTSCTRSRDTEPDPSDCRDMEVCDIYADCDPDPNSNSYRCVCRFPFVGNGFTCTDSRLNQPAEINPTPQCTFGDQCQCPQGFYFYDIRHQCLPQNSGNLRSCDVDPSLCDLNAACVADDQVYRCVCNSGFDGDGSQCIPQDLCRGHAECGQYGECTYNRTELRYSCGCREGFLKEGNRCLPGAEAGCDVLDNCDTNGRCVWESRVSKFECECKPGWLGDGFGCQEDMTGCNVLNNCARNAECAYDTQAKAFRCHCRQGFDGDGTRCRSSIPCYQDRTVCDVNADCVTNRETRESRCQCKQGFQGDGFDCHASGVRNNQYLLVTKGMSIVKVSFNGEKSQPTTVDPLQMSVGIDIDCLDEKVYWSDVASGKIKSAFFNGTSKTSFLTEGIGSPEGLSIDWASKNIYWTDSSKDTIEVANLQTKKRKTLISTDLVNPRGITVYPQRGRVFWSDWNRDYPKIEFAGMDGLGRQVLVGEGLALPNSLIIDEVTDQLCFADAGTHKIECVGVDGRGRRTFVSDVKYPFGLALGSDTFYWSDWETKSIESASRRTGILGQSIEVSLGGPAKLYGIVLVPKTCRQAYSPCGPGSCHDELICLPNIRGGRSCRCTDSALPNCKDLL